MLRMDNLKHQVVGNLSLQGIPGEAGGFLMYPWKPDSFLRSSGQVFIVLMCIFSRGLPTTRVEQNRNKSCEGFLFDFQRNPNLPAPCRGQAVSMPPGLSEEADSSPRFRDSGWNGRHLKSLLQKTHGWEHKMAQNLGFVPKGRQGMDVSNDLVL